MASCFRSAAPLRIAVVAAGFRPLLDQRRAPRMRRSRNPPRRLRARRPPAGRGRGGAPASPAAAEQHRLPPDSTTKQTLALPGRTLDFTATAGSIRLFDDKGEPQADIAYTAYQLDGADARTRPVTFLFNGGPGAPRPGCNSAHAGPGGSPSTPMRRRPRPRRIFSPTPRPGSTSPIWSSSIRSAPAIAASSRPARTCASGSFRSTATSIRSR